MKHILVAIDGSKPARAAALWAAALAKATDSRLSLLYVLEPPHVLPVRPMDAFAVTKAPTPPDSIARAHALLDEVRRDLPAGHADAVVEVGRPVDVILEFASHAQVDHIVVGARGLSPSRRWLVGSVSDRVVHHAHCPVTVVR